MLVTHHQLGVRIGDLRLRGDEVGGGADDIGLAVHHADIVGRVIADRLGGIARVERGDQPGNIGANRGRNGCGIDSISRSSGRGGGGFGGPVAGGESQQHRHCRSARQFDHVHGIFLVWFNVKVFAQLPHASSRRDMAAAACFNGAE